MNRADYGIHKLISIENITRTVFKLRFERNGLEFVPGQHISVGPESLGYTREYSVYSGAEDPWLEVLVKEVIDGWVSPQLRRLQPGDGLMVEAPLGYFRIAGNMSGKHLFVATGTGIAPFHSFVRTFPELDYHLIHGVTDASEACERDLYGNRLTLCTSRAADGNYHGRVTAWLEDNKLDVYYHFYLCGNRKMINDAFQILMSRGIKTDNIHAEAYF